MSRVDGSITQAVDGDLLAGLGDAVAYPEDPGAAAGVEQIQTHISYVFLTSDRVYKFRKAVDLGFLDFSTRKEREADCLRELQLNRRLAPDVYLGVARATRLRGRVRVGEIAEGFDASTDPLGEPCVVMRRLADGRDTLSLLQSGRLRTSQVLRMAERVASFHAQHRIPVSASMTETAWFARMAAPARACLDQLETLGSRLVSARTLQDVNQRVESFLAQHAPDIEARRRAGHFVDGHGDLHLDHCWFEEDESEPLFIDCIEFREDFRQLDPASEVAFPLMDFTYRGRREFGESFLRGYLRASDDYELLRVLDFYATYRALVRAKVAAIAASESELSETQRREAAGSLDRHLRLARRLIARKPAPGLYLVSGIVGSGKSTAADVVARATHGVTISSDPVRKSLAGMSARDRGEGAWRAGLYSEAMTERVYAGMLERALPVIETGRVAVLDATYSKRVHREAVARWAADKGLALHVIEAHCPEGETLRRLARRKREGLDASDAGPELYAASRANFEPWEAGGHQLHVDTSKAGWRERLRRALREMRDSAVNPDRGCRIA